MRHELLLIDLGNTRAKWCLAEPSSEWDFSSLQGAFPNTESLFSSVSAIQLQEVLSSKKLISHILICNVAHASIESMWRQWLMQKLPGVPISIFSSSLSFLPIQNHYQAPDNLGNDRWASIIGATHYAPTGNYLVVNSGTATTIDYVNQNLVFSGGWILPGINMMLQALGSKTAMLPNLSQTKNYHVQENIFGSSTEQAILQGVLHAQVGAIQFALLSHPEITHLILSGGNANLIQKHLITKSLNHCHVIHDPYIVFRGMCLWYQQKLSS
jgi:type III pantothenate kinase